MSKPRLAFIGCGRHATHNIYPTLRYTDASLEAVCNLNQAPAQRNARAFGAPKIYDNFVRMLDEVYRCVAAPKVQP